MNRRRTIRCPWWCGGAHHCTARLGGEHRSAPVTIPTAYGTFIATRVATAGRADWLELRASIALDADPAAASDRTAAVTAAVHRAISHATATPVALDSVPRAA